MTFSCILSFDCPPFNSAFLLFLYFLISLQPASFLQSLLRFHRNMIYSTCFLQHPLSHVSFPDTWPLWTLTTTSTQLSKNLSSRSTYEKEHPVFVSLGMAYHTQYNIFQFHSFSCIFHFSLMLSKIQLCEWFMIVTC